MNERVREIAFRFAQSMSRYDPLYVVLYGSAARGTDTPTSDLDFLVVFDAEELPEEILREVGHTAARLEAEYDTRLEVVCANSAFAGLDKYYVEKVFSEGVLLYARRADLTLDGAPVRPYTIISFSADNLTNDDRSILHQLLWGNGNASTDQEALLPRLKALELGDGALLVPTDKVGQVEQSLTERGVTYVKLDVWLPA